MKKFSKQVIRAMIGLWFAGAALGAAVVIAELVSSFLGNGGYSAITIHLPELLTYIGAPVGSGILGYLLKSAFENREKIKQNYIPDYDDRENDGGF